MTRPKGPDTASMQMKSRIAALALAIGFMAAPALAAVAMHSCPPCCPQPSDAPCHTGDVPCVSLVAVPCCGVAPAAPASQAKRSADSPTLHWVATSGRPSTPVPQHARALRIAMDLALLASPLRLSVVLLI